MKKLPVLLIAFFMCIFTASFSQQIPTDTIKISNELFYIRHNLSKCHKEFKTGTTFYLTGVILVGIGFTLEKPDALMIIGGMSTLVGSILWIDSHKWIKRAGIGFGGQGVIIKYTL